MINDRIKELRTEQGLTLKQLGALLGVSESAVSLYESGKRELNFGLIIKLSEIFDVSLDYLFKNECETVKDLGDIHIPQDLYRVLYKDALQKGRSVDKLVEEILRASLENTSD